MEETLDWLSENSGVSRTLLSTLGHEPVYAALNAEAIGMDDPTWNNPDFLELIGYAESLPKRPDGDGDGDGDNGGDDDGGPVDLGSDF